jgi:SulP family sulfate permease
MAASLFSGYAGSGSFTRSAVNFSSGGKTPMSGVFSGITVALLVLLAAPLAAKLPVAALAGVLMVVAYQMIQTEDIKRAIRATRSDGAVLLVTFLSTLFLHLEFAVYVGVLLSIGLHLAETAHPRIHSSVPDLKTGRMVGTARGRICCQMDIVTVEGAVFFGSVTFVLEDLERRLRNHPRMAKGRRSLFRRCKTQGLSGIQEFWITARGWRNPFPHHHRFCHSAGDARVLLPGDMRCL